MKLSPQSLIETLTSFNFDAKLQDETNQVYFVFEHEKKEFPIFFRTLHEAELLQILTFVPCQIKAHKISDVARFLHMLNKELDVPGFCLDEQSSTIFYRLLLPTLKQEFEPEALEAFVNTSQVVCKSFATVIDALANGTITLEEILKKAGQLKTA